jgi:hypothetical protein
MSNNRRKNWFHFGWHPAEEDLLLFLDGEASERQAGKVRAHLEGCWACRNQRDKLDRAIATFMDYCEAEATDASALPPRASLQFAERLRLAASTQPKPPLIQRWTETLRWQFAERRIIAGAAAGLLLVAALGLILLRAERPVSAQELLRRTTQAETLRLSRVAEPVVYRKLLVKRAGVSDPVVLESWNDAERKQFRRRVADGQGLRFLRADEKDAPAIIAELEQIFRANRFDPQRPLSAAAFAEWRQAIKTKTETVAANGDELKLTTVAAPPYAVNAITEAALIVRKSDWRAVALELRVQAENELRDYELSETAYEVLPLQALTVFADLPLAPTPAPSPSLAPKVSPPPALVAAAPAPTLAAPSRAALQAAEVAALYTLHQAQADLGEQIEVVVEDGRQIVVRGLVQTSERKEELTQALRRIALVSPQLLTVEEAIRQAQRATTPPAANETALAMSENVVAGGQPAAAVNPFQQKLIEHFGGRKGMSEAERQEVNRQVTQFYNAVEADASAALAEAWALRRLQERFASTTGAELDAASRQRLEEMQNNHLARLRRRSRDLQARLRPLVIAITGDAPAVSQPIETTRQAQILAAFRAIEQVSRLTDQLIAGETAASLPQTARALLIELARLDAALTALEKN